MNSTVKRTLTGGVFLVIIIGALLLNRYLFAAVLLFIMETMMHEFMAMTMGTRHKTPRLLAFATAATMFIVCFLICSQGISGHSLCFVVLPFLLLLGSGIHCFGQEDFSDFSHLLASLLYIAVPISCINFMAFKEGEFSGMLILGFMVLIWASDVGAYLFGMALGQRPGAKKLCPSISPKKSWAGIWGGLAVAVLAAVLLKVFGLFEYKMIHCIVLAVVMNVAGVYGDLFESQWKRHYGIKDSGNIMPGHGGLLDRFDSALMAIPAGALYLMIASFL